MRPKPWMLATLGLAVVAPVTSAHRLDELLQAAQISIAPTRLTLDLYMSPGVDIAPAILAKSDTDHNGRISSAEVDAYARTALRTTTLTIDGTSLRPALLVAESSTSQELLDGLGSIHLRAAVDVAHLSDGRHNVTFRNNFEPALSIYSANAVLPDTPDVHPTADARCRSEQDHDRVRSCADSIRNRSTQHEAATFEPSVCSCRGCGRRIRRGGMAGAAVLQEIDMTGSDLGSGPRCVRSRGL